jgi:type I restriction enzyme S subunit
VPLRELCEFFADGDWVESKDQSPTGIRLVQTGNIGEGAFKLRAEKARYISEATFKRLRCTEIFQGDYLVSRLPEPVGRGCIIPETGERMITAVDCTIIRFDRARILPEFFSYYSQSAEYLSNAEYEATGTTRKRISRKKLGQITVPVPPLAEQKRIAGILDKTFAAIAAAERNTEKCLINGNQLDDIIFEAKLASLHSWRDVAFGEIAEFRNGINFTKGSTGVRVKIVGVGEFKNRYWVPSDSLEYITSDGALNSQDVLKRGDIVLVRSNGNPELIGRSMIAGMVNEPIVHSGFTIRARLTGDAAMPEYICYYLKRRSIRIQLTSGGTGLNIKSLNQRSLSTLNIVLPPFSEQESLVSTLNTYYELTEAQRAVSKRKIAALGELRHAILAMAFSGEMTHEPKATSAL